MLFEAGDDAASSGLDSRAKARGISGAGGLKYLRRDLTAGRLRRCRVSQACNEHEQQ
jgi:hypothetical protein